jgi:hypothetical protein
MSEVGLGRVKTRLMGCGLEDWAPAVSGRDGSDQRPDLDDVHDPGQVVG